MLGRYIFGEGDHRALRRAISDARRLGDERRVRSSVDNRSAARRNHMRYRMLASDNETTDIRQHHLVTDIEGSAEGVSDQNGRAQVRTPVDNAHLGCGLRMEKKKQTQ